MATINDFERVFGKLIFLKEENKLSKVTKKVKSVFVTPKGDGILHGVVTTDGEIYSTFEQKIGKNVEQFETDDIVEIEFVLNKKGYKNFTSLKLVEDDKEFTEKEENEKVEKQNIILKQSSAKVAAEVLKSFDLDGLDNEGRLVLFRSLWKTVFEEFNE